MASASPKAGELCYCGYVYDNETGLYYLQSRYYDAEAGRFLNADALVATGQGLLGNNMFSYCLNNPVNQVDSCGFFSLWFYLTADHEMGFIHNLVSIHIIAKYGKHLFREFRLNDKRRADIVDRNTGAVWEIKHAGKDPVGRALEAKSQAESYLQCTGTKGDTTVTLCALGSANAFSGTLPIYCEGYVITIEYSTPQDGVILYRITAQERVPQKPLDAVQYIPHQLAAATVETTVAIGIGYIVYWAIVGFAGGIMSSDRPEMVSITG